MFRKRKHKENPLQDKVAGKIANGLMLLQTKLADRMNKLRNLKVILITFCVINGGLSIYFLVDAMIAKPKQIFKVEPIRMPQYFDRSADEVMESKLPDDIYRQMQDYKKYMDSTGQPIRPGLADSMRVLEQIYLQQQK